VWNRDRVLRVRDGFADGDVIDAGETDCTVRSAFS